MKFKNEMKIKHMNYGYQQQEGDVKYTSKKILLVTTISVGVGAIAAVIGIGGGLLFIPMLLIIGYSPFVASSTSMFMIMYSAAADFISYTIAGEANIPYAFWLSIWA